MPLCYYVAKKVIRHQGRAWLPLGLLGFYCNQYSVLKYLEQHDLQDPKNNNNQGLGKGPFFSSWRKQPGQMNKKRSCPPFPQVLWPSGIVPDMVRICKAMGKTCFCMLGLLA